MTPKILQCYIITVYLGKTESACIQSSLEAIECKLKSLKQFNRRVSPLLSQSQHFTSVIASDMSHV